MVNVVFGSENIGGRDCFDDPVVIKDEYSISPQANFKKLKILTLLDFQGTSGILPGNAIYFRNL